MLKARVTNVGSLGVRPGALVAFYQGTSAAGTPLGTATITSPLLPGGSTTLSLQIAAPTTPTDYFAVADSASTVAECDESNNSDGATAVTCPVIQ